MSATRRAHAVVATLLLLAAAVRGVSAQSLDGDAVFQALTAEAQALRGALGDSDPVARIEQALAVLERARSAALGGRISAEYRDSLLADVALLKRASALLRSGDRAGALAAAAGAEADLAVKRAHAEASVAFSSGGLRSVRVTVRTMRGAQEERGYVVWFVARGWAGDPRHYARFDELSSPTAALLAPGNYMMWPGEAAGAGGEPIVVGGNGRSQQTIDLRLP